MEEFTLPFAYSYAPIQDNPKKVKLSDMQIICLAFEDGKFLDANVKTTIPNINIAALRAKTRLAMDGSNPMSLTKESELKNNKMNK